MNIRLIIFSSLVTTGIGAVFGLATAEIVAPKYESQFYQDLKDRYALIGAGLGLAIGAGQETLRQVAKEKDKELARRSEWE
ncbi:MAG: hypothetical protein ACFB4I_04520 [Cyanophyceae cyanobacterium]